VERDEGSASHFDCFTTGKEEAGRIPALIWKWWGKKSLPLPGIEPRSSSPYPSQYSDFWI